MSKVILGIGLPGAGKTTALKPFAEEYGYVYISPDDIRKELSGNPMDQTVNREAWKEVHKRMNDALSQKKTVVVDATFSKRDERLEFIQQAREHGATKVQGVFAATALEIADERNNARERTIPRYAMERIHDHLMTDPPVIEDGFDAVFDINEFQKLERVELAGEHRIVEREFKNR